MSRNGKKLIDIPAGVSVSFKDGVLFVKGSLGELKQEISEEVVVDFVEESGVVKKISVMPATDLKKLTAKQSKLFKSRWGLMRAIASNMVLGVSQGFKKAIKINGVGFKASKQKHGNYNVARFSIGYSHPVVYQIPSGIDFNFESPTMLVISGIDKKLVNEQARSVCKLKKWDPYKGKGLYYLEDENNLYRKEAKKK